MSDPAPPSYPDSFGTADCAADQSRLEEGRLQDYCSKLDGGSWENMMEFTGAVEHVEDHLGSKSRELIEYKSGQVVPRSVNVDCFMEVWRSKRTSEHSPHPTSSTTAVLRETSAKSVLGTEFSSSDQLVVCGHWWNSVLISDQPSYQGNEGRSAKAGEHANYLLDLAKSIITDEHTRPEYQCSVATAGEKRTTEANGKKNKGSKKKKKTVNTSNSLSKRPKTPDNEEESLVSAKELVEKKVEVPERRLNSYVGPAYNVPCNWEKVGEKKSHPKETTPTHKGVEKEEAKRGAESRRSDAPARGESNGTTITQTKVPTSEGRHKHQAELAPLPSENASNMSGPWPARAKPEMQSEKPLAAANDVSKTPISSKPSKTNIAIPHALKTAASEISKTQPQQVQSLKHNSSKAESPEQLESHEPPAEQDNNAKKDTKLNAASTSSPSILCPVPENTAVAFPSADESMAALSQPTAQYTGSITRSDNLMHPSTNSNTLDVIDAVPSTLVQKDSKMSISSETTTTDLFLNSGKNGSHDMKHSIHVGHETPATSVGHNGCANLVEIHGQRTMLPTLNPRSIIQDALKARKVQIMESEERESQLPRPLPAESQSKAPSEFCLRDGDHVSGQRVTVQFPPDTAYVDPELLQQAIAASSEPEESLNEESDDNGEGIGELARRLRLRSYSLPVERAASMLEQEKPLPVGDDPPFGDCGYRLGVDWRTVREPSDVRGKRHSWPMFGDEDRGDHLDEEEDEEDEE